MKKIINKIALIGLVLSVVSVVASQAYIHKIEASTANIIKINVSTGVSVTTASTKLLDASSGRLYAAIVNDGSVPVYISLDGNAAVAGQGIRLNATGGAYEINSLNQVVAQVNAITSSGSANVTVTASQ